MATSALASEVTANLKSSTTATEQNLTLLRALLGVKDEKHSIKTAARRRGNQEPVAKTKIRALPNSKTVKQKKSNVVEHTDLPEIEETKINVLPIAARRKWATEAFNSSLKSLTAETTAKKESGKAERDSNFNRNTSQMGQKAVPLQSRSPNKQPEKLDHNRKQTVEGTNNIEILSSCASAALTCLRALYDDSRTSNHEKFQLERGALVLLNALTSLQLKVQARLEASRIHYEYQKRRNSVETCTSTEMRMKMTFAQLVDIDSGVLDEDSASFVASFQSQVLRLAILDAAEAVTNEFVEVLRSDKPGSPAAVTVSCQEKGIIDRERAGLQLRTISQALHKLYLNSLAALAPSEPRYQLVLAILGESIKTRITACKFLEQTPDLNLDVWSHIDKATRKALKVDQNLGDSYVSGILREFRETIIFLKAHGFATNPPPNVVFSLVDAAERHGKFDKALELLNTLHQGGNLEHNDADILTLRLATIHQKQPKANKKEFLTMLEACIDRCTSLHQHSPSRVQILLLHLAGIRKTAMSVLKNGDEWIGSIKEIDLNIRYCCILLLLRVQRFLHELVLGRKGAATSEDSSEVTRSRNMLTSLLKICDALVTTDWIETLKLQSLKDEYDAGLQLSLDICLDLVPAEHFLTLDATTSSLCHYYAIQISALFWSRYLRSTLDDTAQAGECTELLHASIAAAKTLPASMRKKALFGTKLDKLATEYLRQNNPASARDAFESIICHYIETGVAAECAQNAFSKSSQSLWSTCSPDATSLSRALSFHSKISLNYQLTSSRTGSWFYDDELLSAEERCVLLETQLHAGGEHVSTAGQAKEFHSAASTILEICSDNQLYVYRSRFVMNILRLISKHDQLPLPSTFEDAFISKICSEAVSCSTSTLAPFSTSVSLLLPLQWTVSSGRIDLPAITQHISKLSRLVIGHSSIAALETVVDNINYLYGLLKTLLSVVRLFDDAFIMLDILNMIRHILNLRCGPDAPEVESVQCQIAIINLRLGRLRESQTVFASMRCLQEIKPATTGQSRCFIAYAEHLINLRRFEQAKLSILAVGQQLSTSSPTKWNQNGRERFESDSTLAHAARVASTLAFHLGHQLQAIRFAKQAIKITTSMWSAAEAPLNTFTAAVGNDSTTHSLDVNVSRLMLDPDQSRSIPRLRGAHFLDLAGLHFAALQQMALLSVHAGMYQDAKFYSDQFKKAATASGSSAWSTRACALLGLVEAKSDHCKEAVRILPQEPGLLQQCTFEDIQAQIFLTQAYIHVEDNTTASIALKSLSTCSFMTPVPVIKTGNQLDRRPTSKAPEHQKSRRDRAIKQAPKRQGTKKSAINTANDSKPDTTALSLQGVHIQSAIQWLSNILSSSQATATQESIDKELKLDSYSASHPAAVITNAMIMLRRALHELSSDAVKCVLAETAVALPVRYKSNGKSGRISFIQAAEPLNEKLTKNRKASSRSSTTLPTVSIGERLVLDAHRSLQALDHRQFETFASEFLHLAFRLQSKLALLSSTMRSPFEMSSAELVMQSLYPKDAVIAREHVVIQAERLTSDKSSVFAWPDDDDAHTRGELGPHMNESEYGVDALSDLPESWSIVSLSLSEDKLEMLVSKVTAGHSPFCVRIPLMRPELENDENEELTFQDAKMELNEIIATANTSCHDPRGHGDRAARSQWYAEREALDKRLHAWLRNIENVWLGGFRGLLNPKRMEEEALAKFGFTLNQALESHLPSRRKSATFTDGRTELHDHVLELFLSLGHPDELELDDAVIDLLYFVVDILQFSGERNAYDEIDFDAMLVEVTDALRAYHGAENTSSEGHLILILDKELAGFPWESLPCLQNHSVSRMPSFSSVINRVKKVRQNPTAQSFSLSIGKGAYILNPSGDLLSTQSVVGPILQANLPNFSCSIGEVPTEAKFESCLQDNNLFLYFGHGSGAQYIRGRTIRGMDRCAVALLMGCSSAKMTECGKLESFGMPGYYISGLSGCMAVVGTLWDVTDRDIDRFAVKLMLEWGLINDDEKVREALTRRSSSGRGDNKKTKKAAATTNAATITVTTTTAKEKGRQRDDETDNFEQETKPRKTLDAAVNAARDACLLRYLNGAAPVVYGVPIMLS